MIVLRVTEVKLCVMIKSMGVKGLVDRLIRSRLEEIPFIILMSFLLSFTITRAYVYLTSHDILEIPAQLEFVQVRGTHVHHLSFGIFILAIAGFWSLYDVKPMIHRRLAVFYGIGLGLTFDEFALWLRLKDDYTARITYDAIIIITLLLLNIIYFPGFWKKMGGAMVRLYKGTIGKIF